MRWEGIYPTNFQLQHLSMIMFNYFGVNRMSSSVRTYQQLNNRLRSIIKLESDKSLIKKAKDSKKKEVRQADLKTELDIREKEDVIVVEKSNMIILV